MTGRRILESIVLLVFIALGTCETENYYGLSLGKFLTISHNVKGEVFAVDSNTLFVKGFSYDGRSHDAVFWVGHSEYPDKTGLHVPNDISHFKSLPASENQDFILNLPENTYVQGLHWLAVWNRDHSKSLGSLIFLSPLHPPQPMVIGPLVNTKHGISTGDILIADTQTILIPNFNYDGTGKEAFWLLSKGMKPNGEGIFLLENGSVSPVTERNDYTFMLTLPDGYDIEDYDILSIWSRREEDHYGFVDVPRNLFVPPSLRILQSKEPEMEDFNCEMLNDNLGLEVRWFIHGKDITFYLVGNIASVSVTVALNVLNSSKSVTTMFGGPLVISIRNLLCEQIMIAPSEYMALALSKDDTFSKFDGADAIVTGVDKNGKGFAIDYYFESDNKCTHGGGMCPDTVYGSQDNLQLLNVERMQTEGRENFTMVKFKRHLRAEDKIYDQVIYTDGPQAILWAVGPLDSDGIAGSPTLQSRGNLLLDFGREPMWNCPPQGRIIEHNEHQQHHSLEHKSVAKDTAETIDRIHCPADHLFRAQIGTSPRNNSQKLWYINGIPAPELVIQRGITYTFIVEGGLSHPDHHPFYITDSQAGGLYKNILEANEEVEITYAGIVKDTDTGVIFPTAEGRLCVWSQSDADPQFSVVNYRSSETEVIEQPLVLNCEPGEPGKLIWTPTAATPNEVYYQSYTERNLGGKIRVVDFCEETNPYRYVEKSTIKGGKPNVIPPSKNDGLEMQEQSESVSHAEKENFSIDENSKKVERLIEDGSPEIMNEKYSLKPDKNTVYSNFIYSSGISSDKLTERRDIGEKHHDLVNETVNTTFRETENSDEVFPHDESERSDKYVSNLENSRKSTNQINAVLNSHTNADDAPIKYPTHSASGASSISALGKPFRQEFKPQFEGGFIPLVTNPMKEKESVQKKEFVLPPHHQNRPHRPFLYNESVPFHGTFKPGVPDFSGFNISNYSQEDASIIFAPVGQDNLALLSAPKPHSVPRNFPPIGAIPMHLLDRPSEIHPRPQRVQAFGPRFQPPQHQPSLVEVRKNAFPHLPVNGKQNFPIPNIRGEDLTGLPSQRVYVSMQTTGEKKVGHPNLPNQSIPPGYNRNVQNSQQGKIIYPPSIQRRPDFYEEKNANIRHPNEPRRKFNTPQGFPNTSNKQTIHQTGKVPIVQSGMPPPQSNNRQTISNSNIPINNFQGSAEKNINPQGPLRLTYQLMNMPQRERRPQNPLFFKSVPIRSNPILFEKSNMNGGHLNHPHIPGLMLPLPIHMLNHSDKTAEVFKEPQVIDSNLSKEQRPFPYSGNAESAEAPNKNIPQTVTRDKTTMNHGMIIQNLPFNETLGAFVLSTNLKSPQSVPGTNFQENKPSQNIPISSILNDESVNIKEDVPSTLISGENNPVKTSVLIRATQNPGDNRAQITKEKNDQGVKYDDPHRFNSRPASFLDHEMEKYVFETLGIEKVSSSEGSKENPATYLDYDDEDHPDSSDSIITDKDYLHYNVPFGARLKFSQNGSRVPVKSMNETRKIPSRINRRPETYPVSNSNRNSDGFIKSVLSTTSTTSTTRPATAVPSTISTTTEATLIAMESVASNTFNEKQQISTEKEEKVKNLYYDPPFPNFHVDYQTANSSTQDTKASYEFKYTPIIADTLDDIGETGHIGIKNILLNTNSNSSFPSLIVPPNASEDIYLPQISDNPPTHDNRTDYSILNHVLTLIGGPP